MPEKTAVAWCAGCEQYFPVDAAGTLCGGSDCGRTLRRRVGYICKLGCETKPIFFDRKEFEWDQRDHKRGEGQAVMPECARCGKKVAVTMSVMGHPDSKPTPQLCLPCFRKRGEEVFAALKKAQP